MKSFRQVIAEVAQPRERGAHEEQAFKDQHTYEVIPHPVALDNQFTGDIAKPQAMRPADNKGDATYDQAYSKGVFEEETDLQENPAEEIPMMQKQLEFMCQACNEIKESLGNGDPKEWYQNKLTAAYEAVKTLHANMQNEELSPKQKKIDHDNDGDIDGKDLAALRAKKGKKKKLAASYGLKASYGEDLDEGVKHSDKHVKMAIGIASDKRYKGGNMSGAVKAMNKMKPGISDHPQVAAVLKRQNEEFEVHETTMSAVKKPVTMTGPDGKTRTVMKTTKAKRTDDSGQDKIITNESIIQELEENIKFKVGMMKLKNGKSVVLKKQDADLLTQMFKDLSANNRRKLGQVAMKDEAGFKEILGFAREAL